jgi:KTSC domain
MPSAVIRGFAYDRASRSLEVRFATGRRYLYREVPAEVADEFRAAFVKGRFFNQRIRDRYDYEELDTGEEFDPGGEA